MGGMSWEGRWGENVWSLWKKAIQELEQYWSVDDLGQVLCSMLVFTYLFLRKKLSLFIPSQWFLNVNKQKRKLKWWQIKNCRKLLNICLLCIKTFLLLYIYINIEIDVFASTYIHTHTDTSRCRKGLGWTKKHFFFF